MESSQQKLTKTGTPITEFESKLSKEDAGKQAQRWLVLRNKTRLRIIDLLNRYDRLLCVSEVAYVLDESPSVISNHLALLKAAGLVEVEKHQTYAYYRIKPSAFDGYWDYLEGFVGK